MRSVTADLKHGFRILRTTPLFAVVAILTLGIGIGSNAAMLSLFDALLFRPPEGVHGAKDIVRVSTEVPSPDGSPAPQLSDALSYMDYQALRDRAKGFSGVAAFTNTPLAVGEEDATNEPVLLASGAYFQTLGARPALGRLLQPQDDRDGAPAAVAVLSYDYWKRFYAGDPGAIGKTIHIAKQPFTIVGVAQQNFTGTELNPPTLWVPLNVAPMVGMNPEMMRSPFVWWLSVIARVKANTTQANARTGAQIALLSIQEEKARAAPPGMGGLGGFGGRVSVSISRGDGAGPGGGPGNARSGDGRAGGGRGDNGRGGNDSKDAVNATPAPRVVFSSIGGAGANLLRANRGPGGGGGAPPIQLWYLALTGALLLIACANVATLLLAQGSRRAHELAVRSSMGASSSRLIRQLLTENIALAALGGVSGLAVAFIIWKVLPNAIAVPHLPPILSARPLLVTAALSLFTVGLFGLIPALGMRRPDIRGVLGAASPTIARRSLTRNTLVVLQLAASLVLLISAGLITRSLRNVRMADLGFASNHVLEVSPNLRGRGWSPQQVTEFWDRARDAAMHVKGVQAAGTGFIAPYQGRMMMVIQSSAGNGQQPQSIDMNQDFASPQYFDALGIRIREGRAFTDADRETTEPVAIVTEQLAKRLFPQKSALNQCMPDDGDGGPCVRIVGIANNARLNDITGPAPSELWRPLSQRPPMMPAANVMHVRFAGDPKPMIAALRKQIAAVAPDLPFINVRSIDQVIEPQLAPWRAATILLSVLSISGLLLATIGLYGVTAFLVTQRTREIGIRVALGANRKHIITDVLGGGLKLTAIGIVIGGIASAMTARLFKSLMYGVTAVDASVYVTTIGLLVVVAIIACILPARKATKVDPATAFRAT